MSTILGSQPYARYPIVHNPYEVPSYKRYCTYSTPLKDHHENCVDIHSLDNNKSDNCSTKNSSSSCSNESHIQKYPKLHKRQINSDKRNQLNKKLSFETIKKQLQDKDDVGINWLLTSKINLVPRPMISSNKKTTLPTPNMDMFQVNDLNVDKNSYVPTERRIESTSLKQSSMKRPQSVPTTYSRPSISNNSDNDTNILPTCSQVNKPFQYSSKRSLMMKKVDRPSSAPCTLEEYHKTRLITSELEKNIVETESIVLNDDSTKQNLPTTEHTPVESEENINKVSTISQMIIDKKLLKQCKIILEDEYDQAVKYHGWRMEIPGDPLNLKSQLLPKRLPYTVKLHLQPTLPQPPKMIKQNIETFFQPTVKIPIPSFTIHPNFTSESYNKHRNYLIKKGLWNYATRSYSFVY
ncbi:hypothetical protein EWB00_000500 [Schistosoma japonicum]|uniref:Uncharacterized protein n=1 Tax=Schistosoma japonicum TaxID=6182 RepID=A0A4Z2DIV0_SCHJA|nr:hypothetical protein EWB00_000500 [Schistosoma japonicum]TNN16401.1 hypothetical protein EWB00_000500 [Schistosoma japonicum]